MGNAVAPKRWLSRPPPAAGGPAWRGGRASRGGMAASVAATAMAEALRVCSALPCTAILWQYAIHCAWCKKVSVTRDTYEGRSEQGKALSKNFSTRVSWGREKIITFHTFFFQVSMCHVSQKGGRRQRGYSPRPTFDRETSRRSPSRFETIRCARPPAHVNIGPTTFCDA